MNSTPQHKPPIMSRSEAVRTQRVSKKARAWLRHDYYQRGKTVNDYHSATTYGVPGMKWAEKEALKFRNAIKSHGHCMHPQMLANTKHRLREKERYLSYGRAWRSGRLERDGVEPR